jgi:Histone H1-like protein Hc1
MKKYHELKELVDNFEQNFEKYYGKGFKAAGVRLRKDMQKLREYARDVREDVQEKNKNRPSIY